MSKDTEVTRENRVPAAWRSALDEILREGARRMLAVAIESEAAAYIEAHQHLLDPETGHRVVVRNGHQPERTIQCSLGDIRVRKPRVRDGRPGRQFTSRILPRYMRRTPCLETLLLVLYLKGVSTGDFPEALASILGEDAAGLSASTISRLTLGWQEEHEEWAGRDLTGKRYVYWWVDGIYFNVRLTDDRPCLLVIMGALADGTKELVGIWDGERESKLSWMELLRDLRRRGIERGPELVTGDGALGFWSALEEVFPRSRAQRCWVHKTANVLDKMPRKVQPSAKGLIHEMYRAPTRQDALAAYDEFMALYGAKFPKACECLAKDKEALFAFYDFPAEHWAHIRTTNPIESTFATVRHRTRQTKGCGSRQATLGMVYKLAREAEKRWRRINAYELIDKVIEGVPFQDGIELRQAA